MKKKTCCTQTYNEIKITGEVCYLKFVSPRPVLFIVGEKAESAYFSKGAYDKALQPKGYIVIPGASHIDSTTNRSISLNR